MIMKLWLFIEDNDIKALIDNVRTSKLRNGNGSKKKYSTKTIQHSIMKTI